MKVKVEEIPIEVIAEQFQPQGSESNIFDVVLPECSCDAMDAYTCAKHRNPPKYHFVIRNTSTFVNPGDWIVWYPSNHSPYGRCIKLTDAEFKRRFRILPNQGQGAKDGQGKCSK
jgi:hypothetical protein